MAGAFFESFVIAEIIKSYHNKGILEPPLYFYRDKDMNEIDLLIENGGTLYPLEIKNTPTHKKDLNAFALINKIPNARRGSDGVICLYKNSYRIDLLIIKKLTDKIIPKNIALIFKTFNLFEIKGIGSSISIDSYYIQDHWICGTAHRPDRRTEPVFQS